MKRRAEPRPRIRLPALLVPWLAYVGVTLVAPALNGAWRRPEFATHALVTIAVSGALLGIVAVAWRLAPLPAAGETTGRRRNGAEAE